MRERLVGYPTLIVKGLGHWLISARKGLDVGKL